MIKLNFVPRQISRSKHSTRPEPKPTFALPKPSLMTHPAIPPPKFKGFPWKTNRIVKKPLRRYRENLYRLYGRVENPPPPLPRLGPRYPKKKIPINPRINSALGIPHSAIARPPRRNYNPKDIVPERCKNYYQVKLERIKNLFEVAKRTKVSLNDKQEILSIPFYPSKPQVPPLKVHLNPVPLHGPPGTQIKHQHLVPPTQPQNYNRQHISYSYFVERSKNQELPVYFDIRNGRTQLLTVVRRIQGDIKALVEDLRQELFPNKGRKKHTIIIKQNCSQIVVKGRFDQEIKLWLHKKGF
ncbi:hypothetical protein G9A89_005492 [Geosiphon pyriformis]|nr:hypothetical protein G9A89_005492 [Geosiphon pyriformis]